MFLVPWPGIPFRESVTLGGCHGYCQNWRAFIAILLVPAFVAVAIWNVSKEGVNTNLAYFDPCAVAVASNGADKGKVIQAEKCIFIPLPEKPAKHWKSGSFTKETLPRVEIKSRYLYLLLVTASILGSVVLFIYCLACIRSVSSKRYRGKLVNRPMGVACLGAFIIAAYFILTGWLDGGFSHAITKDIFRLVFKAIPWSVPLSAEDGRTVYWVLNRIILPINQGVFAAVVVVYVFATAMQLAPPPFGRMIKLTDPSENDYAKVYKLKAAAADYLWRRIQRIRQMMITAAVVLAFGIASFRAFVNWPSSILDGLGYKLAAQQVDTLTSGIVTYWSIVSVGILLSTYLVAMYAIRWPVRDIAPEDLTRQQISSWASEAGLRIDLSEQLKLIVSLLAPLLIGTGDKLASALTSI